MLARASRPLLSHRPAVRLVSVCCKSSTSIDVQRLAELAQIEVTEEEVRLRILCAPHRKCWGLTCLSNSFENAVSSRFSFFAGQRLGPKDR